MNEDIVRELMSAPSLDGVKRALFVQPHPDDNEIAAGGLMAKLVLGGAEVWGLTVTDDRLDCPAGQWQDDMSLRQREASAAMDSLGVRSAGFLGFADKTDATAEEIAEKLVGVIREIRPDAVFSADPTLTGECHRDHIKVGWAVRYAVMDAVCDFFPRLPGGARHRDIWQTPILGQYYPSDPNTLVDIGDCYEAKRQAVLCHGSQVSPELMSALDMQSLYFGARAGCRRAEAFKLYSFMQLHCFDLPVIPRG